MLLLFFFLFCFSICTSEFSAFFSHAHLRLIYSKDRFSFLLEVSICDKVQDVSNFHYNVFVVILAA